jgi:hypothetical protein
VNGQGAATSTGFFPPQVVPDDVEAWRGPRSCASARKSVATAPRESKAPRESSAASLEKDC